MRDDPYRSAGANESIDIGLNVNQMAVKNRPLSSYSRVSSNRSSMVPDVSKFLLVKMAQDIIKYRGELIQAAQLSQNGTRTKQSASDHVNLLKKIGI
jgi:hypothetical protein